MAGPGAPIGNQNAVKAKRWQQAIDRALEKRSKAAGIDELDRLAELFLSTIEDMTQGNAQRAPSIAGFVDLADRMDGKAQQTIQADVDASLTVTVKQFTLPPGGS